MTDLIHYLIILSCFLVSAVIRILQKKKFSSLNAALMFAAIADIFLIFTDMWAAGIVCFMAVQVCYRIALDCGFKPRLAPAVIFYFPISIMNFVRAIKKSAAEHGRRRVFFALLAAGIILLFLCDINVVASNLNIFPGSVRLVSKNLIWRFYIPSQVLIVISSFFGD